MQENVFLWTSLFEYNIQLKDRDLEYTSKYK